MTSSKFVSMSICDNRSRQVSQKLFRFVFPLSEILVALLATYDISLTFCHTRVTRIFFQHKFNVYF